MKIFLKNLCYPLLTGFISSFVQFVSQFVHLHCTALSSSNINYCYKLIWPQVVILWYFIIYWDILSEIPSLLGYISNTSTKDCRPFIIAIIWIIRSRKPESDNRRSPKKVCLIKTGDKKNTRYTIIRGKKSIRNTFRLGAIDFSTVYRRLGSPIE